MPDSLIAGCATPEGTQRFKERFEGKGAVAAGHFRTTAQGLHLSSIGMGTYLGDTTAQTDADTIEAVKASIQSGVINVLDTAINYRFQRSERCVGAALRQLIDSGVIQRDEVFVSTKNGFITQDANVTEDFPTYFKTHFLETEVVKVEDIAQGMHCMSPSYLKDQLERSRANLGLETIDLMYLHNASETQIPEVGLDIFLRRLEAAFQFYEQARAEGKIRYYGMATWDCFRIPADIKSGYFTVEAAYRLAENVGGPDHGFRFIQLPYNAALIEAFTQQHQKMAGQPVSAIDAANRLGVGVFTSVPLMQGQLLSQVRFQFPGLDQAAQQCLQFARSTPGVLAPLVGHKKPEHVAQNLKVGSVPPLSQQEFEAFFMAPSV
jgi:aryl-alcohol dehydrogenase-like predicted oxidoreductase